MDFRPLSGGNTIYKCIAKILAKRSRTCLPALISQNQTAFVHGRKIGDNVPLTQETVSVYDGTGAVRSWLCFKGGSLERLWLSSLGISR